MSNIVYVRDIVSEEWELLEKFKVSNKEATNSKAFRKLLVKYFELLDENKELKKHIEKSRKDYLSLYEKHEKAERIFKSLKEYLKPL
jgi:uncharacterized membrane-anchored protein YjiN (DUF445 family)